MRGTRGFEKVFFYSQPTDMRKSINGLSAMVQTVLNETPFQNSLFLFISKNRKILKALYWDRTGFAVWHKRLEKERFPKAPLDSEKLILSQQQLDHFLDGFDIWRHNSHKTLFYNDLTF